MKKLILAAITGLMAVPAAMAVEGAFSDRTITNYDNSQFQTTQRRYYRDGGSWIGGRWYYDGNYYDRPLFDRPFYRDRYRNRYRRDSFLFTTHCAPEVVSGNIAKTDRVLTQLASSPDFRDAKTFRTRINNIRGIEDVDQKLQAYFSMLDIDATNESQVAEFLGARDARTEWILALEKHANLTPRQADQVVNQLSSALRGGLR